MATLTLTVDDSLLPRLKAAYGVSTSPQLRQSIIDDIKGKVVAFERNVAALAADIPFRQAQATQQATIDAAVTTATAEIVLT